MKNSRNNLTPMLTKTNKKSKSQSKFKKNKTRYIDGDYINE
jgi:hypothetical protein